MKLSGAGADMKDPGAPAASHSTAVQRGYVPKWGALAPGTCRRPSWRQHAVAVPWFGPCSPTVPSNGTLRASELLKFAVPSDFS